MKIQCLLGPTEQVVCGETYVFSPDKYGRFVAVIHNNRHASVFTEIEHYIEVPDVAPVQEEALALGPTAEEIGTQAQAERMAAAAEDAARAAAAEAQALAFAEAETARVAAEKEAAEKLAADNAAVAEAQARAIDEAKQQTAAPATTDNLDTAATQSNDEAVKLPVPKTRRSVRKAAAK